MGVRKDEKRGKWLAESYINGKRSRKWFNSKADATRYFNAIKMQGSDLNQFINERKKAKQPKIIRADRPLV